LKREKKNHSWRETRYKKKQVETGVRSGKLAVGKKKNLREGGLFSAWKKMPPNGGGPETGIGSTLGLETQKSKSVKKIENEPKSPVYLPHGKLMEWPSMKDP